MNQGDYDGQEPGTPQVVGWGQVVEHLNPIFKVEVESGFLVVLPTREKLAALVYAFEHLTQGMAAGEVITKLEELGETFVHGYGTFDVS